MIFQNIEFHNVAELEQTDKGYIMWRVPADVRAHLNPDSAQGVCRFGSGIELRFRMVSDTVNLVLRTDPIAEAQVAYIYYGAFQAGFMYSSKVINAEETVITIAKPEGNAIGQDPTGATGLEIMRKVTTEHQLAFDPEVVRVVIPYGHNYFVRLEGEVLPPEESQLPAKTYLAYGSSITHGSLGLATPFTYAFRVSQEMRCDYLNLGFAGNAHLEPAIVDYIVGRKDWDFGSFEWGINMMGDQFPLELFEKRVKYFIEKLTEDGRPVVVTGIFGYLCESPRTEQMREIVRRNAKGVASNICFVDAKALLNNPSYVSADLIHPTAEGQLQIGDRMVEILEEHIRK
ncbi:MAG: SGNH/GDSL hydrolase family protein [Lachnospiraceae bacterium]|nr:SGNH/GDSL hydrolase family protein [Lachnospiraceae bacterium]